LNRSHLSHLLLAALLLAPAAVFAQEPEAAPSDSSTRSDFWHDVAGQSGFQLALRLGGAFPAGSADKQTGDLSAQLGSQFALNLDLGGKANKYVFIGAFFGAGFGGVGDGLTGCTGCSVKTLRVGPEVLVSILPDLRINPWVGVGIGFEYSPIDVAPFSLTQAPYGPEFAHIMFGADYRLNSYFGVGPFFDVSIAEFTTITQSSGGTSLTHEIPQKALHEWVQVGVRFVLFP